jgi:hypothetical protein
MYEERVKETVAALVAAKKDVKDFVNSLPKF